MDEDKHEFPILTVDGAIFQIVNGRLCVLLIERGFEPFKGAWALPGAYISKDETIHQALDRTLVSKTGIGVSRLSLIEQPYAFDAPGRDPRGNSVSVMYIGLCRNVSPSAHKQTPLIQNPTFMPVDNLPALAYDHQQIIDFALKTLRTQAMNSDIAAALLPSTFTLAELQGVYEALFGKALDKRNFRKRIAQLESLTETGEMSKDGAHRPARLYNFKPTPPASF